MEKLCSLSSASSTKARCILPSGLIKTTILPVVFMLQLSLMMYSAPRATLVFISRSKQSRIGNMRGILKNEKNKGKSYDSSFLPRYVSFLGRR